MKKVRCTKCGSEITGGCYNMPRGVLCCRCFERPRNYVIEEVVPITGHRVDLEGGVCYRYSANNWTAVMGESEEPIYDCSELEEAFQKFMSKKT